MIMEIIVSVIGFAFIVLVVFFIMTLHRLRKVMKKTDRVLTDVHHLLHDLSEPSIELIHNTNKLIVDVKKKSEGLDAIFSALHGLKKEKIEGSKGFKKICDLLEYALEGARIFSKIKTEMKS
jgi:uncharacterized protein YoxC